ncbi:MAG: thioredoxin-disulfide reductase [Patescibacteria group bacterium]
MEEKYDIIIIGAGPAGFSAAIYSARRNLKTLVVTKEVGGQMVITNMVENYPGFENISGFDLMDKFKKQAEKCGVKFDFGEVKKIEEKDGGFVVKTGKNQYWSKAVILAFGLTHRELKVPGEEKLKGKGVTYCSTCDGPLFKGKTVAVVGGGNAALGAVDYLSKIAKEVFLIHRSDEFRTAPYLIERARKNENVKFYCFSEVKEIKGEDKLESVVLESVKGEKSVVEELKVDGLFVEIGYTPKTDWLKGFIDLNERGEIVTKGNKTSRPGVFAAGDCTDEKYKQIVIAAGDGAKAALEAYHFLAAQNGNGKSVNLGNCELVGSDKVAKVKLEK